jgi:hypothetical protein
MVNITKEIEFFKNEKFVGSAFNFLAYLMIKSESTFRNIEEITNEAMIIPKITRACFKFIHCIKAP